MLNYIALIIAIISLFVSIVVLVSYILATLLAFLYLRTETERYRTEQDELKEAIKGIEQAFQWKLFGSEAEINIHEHLYGDILWLIPSKKIQTKENKKILKSKMSNLSLQNPQTKKEE